MFMKSGIGAGLLLMVLVITILKIPRWLSKPLMRIPGWLQALVMHFGYGGWIGGVTGHILGGLLSVPWFFVCEMYLRPKILETRRPTAKELFGDGELGSRRARVAQTAR